MSVRAAIQRVAGTGSVATWAGFRRDGVVEDVIKECIARGTFRPVDPRLASLPLFGMCNWAYQWYRSSGSIRPREIAYQFWNFLVFGLAADSR